jgi:uncharacterized protein YjiS (DUF1127 family)
MNFILHFLKVRINFETL